MVVLSPSRRLNIPSVTCLSPPFRPTASSRHWRSATLASSVSPSVSTPSREKKSSTLRYWSYIFKKFHVQIETDTSDPDDFAFYAPFQDEVNVFVVRLVGLRIHAPLRRLKVGNVMPTYAVGITSEAETPHAFGSANPALSFVWTINSKQVFDAYFHRRMSQFLRWFRICLFCHVATHVVFCFPQDAVELASFGLFDCE